MTTTTFNVTIQTDNDAFAEDLGGEIARILGVIIERVESGADGGTVRDINGNTVGAFGFVTA